MLVSCYYYSILVLDAIRYINCSLFSIEFVKQSLPTAGVLLWTNKDAFLLEVILVLETTDLTEMQPCLFIKWFQYHAESLCKYLDCVWWWKIAFTTVTTSYVTKLSCDSLMYNGICYCLIYVDVYLVFFTQAILYPNQLCFCSAVKRGASWWGIFRAAGQWTETGVSDESSTDMVGSPRPMESTCPSCWCKAIYCFLLFFTYSYVAVLAVVVFQIEVLSMFLTVFNRFMQAEIISDDKNVRMPKFASSFIELQWKITSTETLRSDIFG